MTGVQKREVESRGSLPDRSAVPSWLRTNPSYPPLANAALALVERLGTSTVVTTGVSLVTNVMSMMASGTHASTQIEPAELCKLRLETRFLPQAIISGDVKELAQRLSARLEENTDDFDRYVGAGIRYGKTPVALMRYDGHPPGQYTMYLPADSGDVRQITTLIRDIVHSLKLPEKAILWERKDNPDL